MKELDRSKKAARPHRMSCTKEQRSLIILGFAVLAQSILLGRLVFQIIALTRIVQLLTERINLIS